MLAGLVVGTAYSTPPLRLKRFPVLASLSISGVRSVVVNLGVYAHFSLAFGDGTVSIPAPVWALTLVRAAVLARDRDPQGRPRRRGRPPLPDHDLHGAARRAARCMQAGIAALVLGYLGMAILGPLLHRHGVSRSCSRAGSWPRSRCCWRGAAASTPPTGGLHALLHARVEAVLPRVRARRARLPGRLATLAQHEERDQGGDPARERDRERRAPAEQRERAARTPRRPAGPGSRPRAGWRAAAGGAIRAGVGSAAPVPLRLDSGAPCGSAPAASGSAVGGVASGAPRRAARASRRTCAGAGAPRSSAARRRPRAGRWGTPPASRRGRSGRRAGGTRSRSACPRPRAAARRRSARGRARRGSRAPRRSRPRAGRRTRRPRRRGARAPTRAPRSPRRGRSARRRPGARRRGRATSRPVQAEKSSKSRCVGRSVIAF